MQQKTSPKSYKTDIKILANPGLALSGFEQPGPSFNVRIVLLSRVTGSVSSGNLSAFDVITSLAREIIGMAFDIVTNGNEVGFP